MRGAGGWGEGGAPVGARKVRGGGRRVGLFGEPAGGGICKAPVGAQGAPTGDKRSF